ncbi:hypothetical protein [uncultured Clostridium sp.]|uniref:hypothetical protein n=1 Tax=uncultured Clostridium sp. TaxID=59620 RepID=UPI00321626C6
MNVDWMEILNVLKVWSCNIGIYGLIAVSVIALILVIHTKVTKSISCNIKLLRKILS